MKKTNIIKLKKLHMSDGLRFIDLVIPVQNLLPEVEAPLKQIQFKGKLIWTAITLFIYLICC